MIIKGFYIKMSALTGGGFIKFSYLLPYQAVIALFRLKALIISVNRQPVLQNYISSRNTKENIMKY